MSEQQTDIKISSPAASEVETAAVVAALRRFLDDNAPAPATDGQQQPAWLAAALSEGVQRQPQLPVGWAESRA
ncbi:unannotated protein [freshwater metagenome]|uniref:Unannotated protein n=1 Tax=freshwater metagenome TaxID=449393 RepID=A0A6J5ZY13_9ZZZZ|nr:hypothetical protein [Actinomycetota bacterium]MSX12190.1 hypothetical protein [Actinomycetota bacterium]